MPISWYSLTMYSAAFFCPGSPVFLPSNSSQLAQALKGLYSALRDFGGVIECSYKG